VSLNPSPLCPNTPGLYTHNRSIDGFKCILLISFVQNSVNQVHGTHSRICKIMPYSTPKTQPQLSSTL
jgi:hypothetical protein